MSQRPLILYDGYCILCNAFIQFLLKRNGASIFYFAPIQSKTGSNFTRNPKGFDTIIFVDENDVVFEYSDAVLRILKGLGGIWKYFYVLRHFPLGIRNGVYRVIASHRYRIFGRTNACMLPPPEFSARFIDFPEEE